MQGWCCWHYIYNWINKNVSKFLSVFSAILWKASLRCKKVAAVFAWIHQLLNLFVINSILSHNLITLLNTLLWKVSAPRTPLNFFPNFPTTPHLHRLTTKKVAQALKVRSPSGSFKISLGNSLVQNQTFYAIMDAQKQNICKLNWNKLEPFRCRFASVIMGRE